MVKQATSRLVKEYCNDASYLHCYSIFIDICIYAERIMRYVLEKWDKGISIGGRKVIKLRYADDTTLIVRTKYDLTELITKEQAKKPDYI